MTKPNIGQGKSNEQNQPEESKVEDLKKSTITDYLPSIFSRKKNEEPAAEGALNAGRSAEAEESKQLKDSVA